MYEPNSLFGADCRFALLWFDSKQISYPLYTLILIMSSEVDRWSIDNLSGT